MLCRVGHHSTSDDSFAYRPRKEVEDRKRLDNPIVRFRLFLEARGWWSKDEETALVKRCREDVNAAYKRAEALPKPPVSEMFSEVYGGEMPWNLVRNIFFFPCSLGRVSMMAHMCFGRCGGDISRSTCGMQKEQKEELARLVKKYGQTWEPWRTELKKHKGEGKDLLE